MVVGGGGVVGNVFGGAFVEAGVGFDGAAGAGVPLILNPETRQIERVFVARGLSVHVKRLVEVRERDCLR